MTLFDRPFTVFWLLLLFLPAAVCLRATSITNKGTDFWLAFPPNYTSDVSPTVYVSSGPVAATGLVEVPGQGFSRPYTLAANSLSAVGIPPAAFLGVTPGFNGPYDLVESKGIHVTASQPVAVNGVSFITGSADGFLALPTGTLGQDYYVMSYVDQIGVAGSSAEFGVVAAAPGTTLVTITPASTALPGIFSTTPTFAQGVPYTETLTQGQTYVLLAPLGFELTGTRIQASQPIAVFNGNLLGNVPSGYLYGDYLVEQALPVQMWGRSYYSVPLATRLNGDTFRVLADQNGTIVKVNASTVATLDQGQFWEGIVTSTAAITASQPVLAAQFSNSYSYDFLPTSLADPFQMTLVPAEQYESDYDLVCPSSGFRENYLNIVAPTAGLGTIQVDGTPVAPAGFSAIGSSGFSGRSLSVSAGAHSMSALCPVGVSVYGYDQTNGYGYPGGMALAAVASAVSLTLTPKNASKDVGQTHCVTATVTDSGGAPVAGARVDFVIAGVNPSTGFSFTDSNGNSAYCYVGADAGADAISATLGPLSATAAATWSAGGPASPPPTASLILTPHYPNPNPAGPPGVWLPYTINVDAAMQFRVYDVSGELVRHFDAASNPVPAGTHEQFWDISNDSGRAVASGVYICKIGAVSIDGKSVSAWEKCAVLR